MCDLRWRASCSLSDEDVRKGDFALISSGLVMHLVTGAYVDSFYRKGNLPGIAERLGRIHIGCACSVLLAALLARRRE